MLKKIDDIVDNAIKLLGSKMFFWIITAIFVLQAAWIAISFIYPLIYDEGFHVPIIELFSHQLSPFIVNQPEAYDAYGNLSNGDASLYHYIMSFPFRIIQIFTKEFMVQVIVLRILNIMVFAMGIVVFSKLFEYINVKRIYVNLGIFVMTVLPMVPFVAAHVNYDNLLFLMTAWYLLIALRILKLKKADWYNYSLLIIVGCITSLIKFTFLPIFAASLVYLVIVMYRRHGRIAIFGVVGSFKNSAMFVRLGLGTVLLLAVGMFSLVYLQNIIRYGSVHPACELTMDINRCMKSDVVSRNIKSEAIRDQRPLSQLPVFVLDWTDAMMRGVGYRATNTVVLSHKPIDQPLPIIFMVIFTGVFVAIGLSIKYWGYITSNLSWNFLITMVGLMIVVVFIDNYIIYYKYHALYAIQARYLLNILPAMTVLAVLLFGKLIHRQRNIVKFAIVLLVVGIFTQGGGVITYILRSDNSWYWNSRRVIEYNNTAKKILRPLVKEW